MTDREDLPLDERFALLRSDVEWLRSQDPEQRLVGLTRAELRSAWGGDLGSEIHDFRNLRNHATHVVAMFLTGTPRQSAAAWTCFPDLEQDIAAWRAGGWRGYCAMHRERAAERRRKPCLSG